MKTTTTPRQVSDTKAGKSISAHIILRRDGTHVATVQAHFSDGGNVLVNVRNFYVKEGKRQNPDYARDNTLSAGSAGGYGYDKMVAALSGLSIDGHVMSNHCGGRKKMPHGGWKRDTKAPKGWSFANSARFTEAGEPVPFETGDKDAATAYWAYTSCYREAGLDYLRAIGYQVISAL